MHLTRDGFDIHRLENLGIDCIVLDAASIHEYIFIQFHVWTKKISLRRIKTDYWFYIEAIIVPEKYLRSFHYTVLTVIVSSSVLRYIKKTTPGININNWTLSPSLPLTDDGLEFGVVHPPSDHYTAVKFCYGISLVGLVSKQALSQ